VSLDALLVLFSVCPSDGFFPPKDCLAPKHLVYQSLDDKFDEVMRIGVAVSFLLYIIFLQ
jgi:hypothetical protein